MNERCVSIIIPIIRPESAARCIYHARVNAGIPESRLEFISEVDEARIGAPKMVKRLVSISSHDLVCFIGDDCIPQPGWLSKALEYMDGLPGGWGLVGLDDTTGRTLACHWLADKRLLPYLGGEFFHTGYRHCYCDNELMDRCIAIKRYVYGKGAVVLHDHPMFKGEAFTGDYARSYNPQNEAHDMVLYGQRRRQWLER